MQEINHQLLELIGAHPLRNPTCEVEDALAQLLCVEEEAWGATGDLYAPREKIRARMESFPEGVTLASVQQAVACGGTYFEPVGSQFAFRFDWCGDPSALTSWEECTAGGWTERVHRPEGNTGFLVGVGVRPEYRRTEFLHCRRWKKPMRASMLLIAETLDKLFDLGVERVIANARVPHYHLQPDMSVTKYCALRRADGLLFDPVLRFHERMGATILKPVAYSMEDQESRNAGCWVLYRQRFED